MQQLKFHTLLGKYFDGGWFSIPDGLISVWFHDFIFRKNASKVMSEFAGRPKPEDAEPKHAISIPVYDGGNNHVLAIREALKPVRNDLLAAIVHGSVATNELIPYSDFDGLIIVKDKVFENKEGLVSLAQTIYSTRKIMHMLDPLQHHGWFIITESDLLDYPSGYMPLEVLSYSKSLLSDADLELRVHLKTKPDYYSPVKTMCRRIRKISQKANRPKTLYQLKSILSEFMMMPTLYIQARDQRGVFKKFSFTAAAADFNQSTWSIMEEVSRMRAEWPEFESQAELEKFRKIGYIWMKYRKKKGPAIPAQFRTKLNDEFYRRMAELANQVEVNLFR